METYVGHRYVPKIMGVWNKLLTYENLSIVTYDNSSYTSKTIVPVGVEISNEKYWVKTGDYNAQVEEFKNDFTAQLAQTVEDVNRATSELTVDSEVIIARGGKNTLGVRINEIEEECDQNFSTYNGRITKLESDYDVLAKNEVVNGDFKNGLSDWFSLRFNATVFNNEVTILASSSYPQFRQTIIDANSDDLYYISAEIKSDSNKVGLGTWGTQLSNHSGSGFYEKLSLNRKNLLNNTISITDTRTSDWTNVSLKKCLVLNLTKTFGLGNEPTSTQMDRLLAQFPNSWFDGTKNIHNSKHMMSIFFKELTKMNNTITALGGNV